MRVLIVEDDPILALLAEIALQEGGHDVLGPALSASQALAMAAQKLPDIALVDINLNGQDEGVDLVKALYHDYGVHSLYVSGQIEVARENSDYAVGLLSKPYSPNDLAQSAQIVHDLVKRRLPLPSLLPDQLTIFTKSCGLTGTRHV